MKNHRSPNIKKNISLEVIRNYCLFKDVNKMNLCLTKNKNYEKAIY